MEKLQIELNNQEMQSQLISLDSKDKATIAIKIGELSTLQNLGLNEEQVGIWLAQIEKDLVKGDISVKEITYALNNMSKIQLYNRFDYATFWELAMSSPYSSERKNEKILAECRNRRT